MKTMTRRQFLAGTALVSLGVIAASCTPQREPTVAASTPVAQAPLATAAPIKENTAAPTAASSATTKTTSAAAPTIAQPTAAKQPTAAPQVTSAPVEAAYLAVVRGADAEAITMRALAAIGGIERFVKNGYDVIIKPNMCNASHGPEYASTTNPDVVAALVKMCLGAGAKRVRVMDFPFSGTGEMAYEISKVAPAVKAAGGEMEAMAPMRFAETPIPDGVDLKKWDIYQPVLEADLVINLPIAKHHSLARLTLGGKNLMGVVLDRGSMHRNLGQRIADVVSVDKPQLTEIDATRNLMANGPTGGNLADVKQANTIIASHDIVAADAYATSLFNLKPEDISYIVAAAKMGLGVMDLSSVKVEELNI